MALLSGLFGEKHPNVDHIAQAIESNLGLTLVKPPPEVIRILDDLIKRELVNYDNVHSVEGMQELFRAKSIRAVVDMQMRLVSLFKLSPEEIDKQLKAEHTQVRVLKLEKLEATQKVAKPAQQRPKIQPIMHAELPSASAAAPLAPPVPGFEHLDAFERMCSQLVDIFLKHGQLNSADKEVLRNIKATDATLEARIVALERWQGEVTRRVRGMMLPKATPTLLTGPTDETVAKPDEVLARRFDALVHWLGKLVKAFEATGVRYHNKPVWLPH